uniref:PH domain-containing protein n=1 Tax=Hucho hucho TaxID=62062 RepID=A0A4W5JWD5_9TELE
GCCCGLTPFLLQSQPSQKCGCGILTPWAAVWVCIEQGPQDTNQHNTQPDKIGWIRKFCGKGIFREIWKNRFVVLKGDQLYISEKEVSDASSLNS